MIENENENKHPVNKTEYLLKPLGLDPIGYTASGEQVFTPAQFEEFRIAAKKR